MTATNHVLTGAVFVALTVDKVPLWIILPVAFLLHFVLDSLLHFGTRDDAVGALNRLKWLLPVDAAIAAAILLAIAIVQPAHWPYIALGGILCASPDLWSASRFVRFLKTGDARTSSDWFARFHHWIQWGERAWGAWIELIWFGTFIWLLWVRL